MSKFLKLTLTAAALAGISSSAFAGGYGLGRAALPEEIAAWDLDVSPDGTGLPVGSGSVARGEEVFVENCAVCHGEFAEGAGNWPKLAGGEGSLADKDPLKTVGSYWPYLSTTWDYIHRSMPFGAAQTVSVDDTYAMVAYILYSNFLVDEDFVLSNENFLEVEMPNADGFIIDDRPQAEYAIWRAEPCMENCKENVEITMRASVLDVTPDEAGAEEMAEAAVEEGAAVAAPAEAPAVEVAALDMELVAAGERVFRKCKSCHQIGEGAVNRTGPQLNGVMGAVIGSVEDFRYSKAFGAAHDEGRVWDAESMAAFLTKPRDYLPGTKMSFAGLRKESDITAVIEYLRSFSQ